MNSLSEAKEERYKDVAYIAYRMVVDGVDLYDQLMLDLETLQLIDDNGEWIYDEEEGD